MNYFYGRLVIHFIHNYLLVIFTILKRLLQLSNMTSEPVHHNVLKAPKTFDIIHTTLKVFSTTFPLSPPRGM